MTIFNHFVSVLALILYKSVLEVVAVNVPLKSNILSVDHQAAVDEFEERLEKVHNKGVEDEEAVQNAFKATAAGRVLKGRNKTPGIF